MKRLPLREFVLLCMTLVVFAGTVAIIRLNHSLQSSASKPTLVLIPHNPRPQAPNSKMSSFGWKGWLIDDEQKPMQVGYSAVLVATGKGHSRVIYHSPTPAQLPASNKVPWSAWSVGKARLFSPKQILSSDLPLWTQRLDWQIEVVAVPCPPTSVVSQYPLPASTLRQWSSLPGALHVSKRMAVDLRHQDLDPVESFVTYQIPPTLKIKPLKADTVVNISLLHSHYRAFPVLESFDGKTRRVLWDGDRAHSNPYMLSEDVSETKNLSLTGSLIPITTTSLFFNLKSVPASYGKVTFRMEAVFDPDVAAPISRISTQDFLLDSLADEATVQRLRSNGWYFSTHELTLRDAPQTQ